MWYVRDRQADESQILLELGGERNTGNWQVAMGEPGEVAMLFPAMGGRTLSAEKTVSLIERALRAAGWTSIIDAHGTAREHDRPMVQAADDGSFIVAANRPGTEETMAAHQQARTEFRSVVQGAIREAGMKPPDPHALTDNERLAIKAAWAAKAAVDATGPEKERLTAMAVEARKEFTTAAYATTEKVNLNRVAAFLSQDEISAFNSIATDVQKLKHNEFELQQQPEGRRAILPEEIQAKISQMKGHNPHVGHRDGQSSRTAAETAGGTAVSPATSGALKEKPGARPAIQSTLQAGTHTMGGYTSLKKTQSVMSTASTQTGARAANTSDTPGRPPAGPQGRPLAGANAARTK